MDLTAGRLTIRLVEGDICERDVGAVVNAANNQLWMGGGVAGAIKRKGGREIEQEAIARGPIPIGTSVLTAAGSLKAQHVIHAAVMGVDLVTSEDCIRRATLSALALARDHSLRSIAFPALGTGVGAFPLAACARAMIRAAMEHAMMDTTVEVIELVLLGREAYEAFAAALQEARNL
jgi:O-acetyl-ADP-ribose deacetylase (regulator of RNase III)